MPWWCPSRSSSCSVLSSVPPVGRGVRCRPVSSRPRALNARRRV
ncbi:hypothetical protein Y09_0677 [Brachybacterium sp. SW0106-09]|nr:hypothetical protein Y09_0677 [Brachybacterium sp. SW0106-09]